MCELNVVVELNEYLEIGKWCLGGTGESSRIVGIVRQSQVTLNGPTGLKIYYMVRTYGRPQDKITYADYIQLGQTAKNEQAKQRKRKIEEEVEELRKKVKQYEDNQ